MPVCSVNGVNEPLERGHQPEVVERLRPQLDGEPAHVLERRHGELAQPAARRSRRSSLVRASSTALSPSSSEVSA